MSSFTYIAAQLCENVQRCSFTAPQPPLLCKAAQHRFYKMLPNKLQKPGMEKSSMTCAGVRLPVHCGIASVMGQPRLTASESTEYLLCSNLVCDELGNSPFMCHSSTRVRAALLTWPCITEGACSRQRVTTGKQGVKVCRWVEPQRQSLYRSVTALPERKLL